MMRSPARSTLFPYSTLVRSEIFRFGSLEARHRTKVGSSWRAVVTDPLERHVNEGAVVGLEREAQVELDHAVSPEERPITAAGQHLSAQPRALEVAARYRCVDARTVRHCADLLWPDDCDLQGHQQTGIHSSTSRRSRSVGCELCPLMAFVPQMPALRFRRRSVRCPSTSAPASHEAALRPPACPPGLPRPTGSPGHRRARTPRPGRCTIPSSRGSSSTSASAQIFWTSG